MWKLVTLLMILSASVLGIERCDAEQDLSSANPTQLAAAIARTMSATRPGTSTNSPIEQQFFSRRNVVVSRTIFKDAAAFTKLVARRNEIRASSIRYTCKPERRTYLKKGVVFQNIFTGPEAAQSFEFSFDEQACATLAQPVIADKVTMQKLTSSIAQQLAATLPKQRPFAGSHFEKLSIQGNTIEITNFIDAPAFVDFFKVKDFEIRGVTQGWFCSKLEAAIIQGVKMRVIFKLPDGPPVLQFAIDNTVC